MKMEDLIRDAKGVEIEVASKDASVELLVKEAANLQSAQPFEGPDGKIIDLSFGVVKDGKLSTTMTALIGVRKTRATNNALLGLSAQLKKLALVKLGEAASEKSKSNSDKPITEQPAYKVSVQFSNLHKNIENALPKYKSYAKKVEKPAAAPAEVKKPANGAAKAPQPGKAASNA